MEIRAVTLFTTTETQAESLASFCQSARTAFHVPVQTLRVATPPYPEWLLPGEEGVVQVSHLVSSWQAQGIDYVSLGMVGLHHDTEWLNHLPIIFGVHDSVFASAEIADNEGQIDIDRIVHVARLVQQLSLLYPNGFGNLYFCAAANCGTGYPFFPIASSDGRLGFSIGVESADIARQIIQNSRSLPEVRDRLIAAIEAEAAILTESAEKLAEQYGVPFLGIDYSLAPYPTDEKSLGGVMEDIGLARVGSTGSLFVAAFLTDTIQRARFKSCGYNGLMLSVLEDSVLARRASAEQLSVQELLSYSAVCGVGLDTIPLAGSVSTPQLTAILLDVAALASRLRKPLTARLMPIPGLEAGDPVVFDFPYFANSCVMPLAPMEIHTPLDLHSTIQLRPINHH